MKKESVIAILDAMSHIEKETAKIACLDYDKVLGKPFDDIINAILEEQGLDSTEDYPFVDVCGYIFGSIKEEDKELLFRELFKEQ